MSQPTGLYGWIQSNDGRSLGLFLGFLIAVQAIAAMVLFLPLTVIDANHAPFLGWGGYFTRYVPMVVVASIAWFGWQMFWHIEAVRRAVGFHFVDDDDEPHLCRVIEPLIMTLGIPIPFVGVIESDARNAFACGVARKKAVVVVTRGLIEDLTDEELACVLGHELSHIKNGDIRLMAAANIFMDALSRLHKNNPLRFTPIHVVLAIAIPAILPLTLVGGFIGHLALRAGQVSRLMIASAREFIADAEAVQLTQNPAAMASALVKVENHWQVEGARRGDDAMMIAGDTEGENATHPTVAQRIAALARTTGSMVFNAPGALPEAVWDSSKSLSEARAAALLRRLPKAGALPRVRVGSSENLVGLTRGGVIMCAFTIFSLTVIHWSEANNPRAILAKFDVRPIALMLGSPVACQFKAAFDHGASCRELTDSARLRDFEGQNNTLAGLLAQGSRKRHDQKPLGDDPMPAIMTRFGVAHEEYKGQSGRLTGIMQYKDASGMYLLSSGVFTSKQPDSLDIAEIDRVGCFPVALNYGDPKGKFPLDHEIWEGINAYALVSMANQDIVAVPTGRSEDLDKQLWAYVGNRRVTQHVAYDDYGLAGLALVRTAYRGAGHGFLVSRLAERLKDSAFSKGKSGYDVASARALVRSPENFVPCAAVKYGATDGDATP